jgi:hypothetical protein
MHDIFRIDRFAKAKNWGVKGGFETALKKVFKVR